MSSPVPPSLPAELDALRRRIRLPHMRRTAPEVLATARAQRWDPAEVLKLLLNEEVAGRERSALATRRVEAAFPTGKTFATWDASLSSIPAPTQTALRTLEWIGRRENLVVCGPSRKWENILPRGTRPTGGGGRAQGGLVQIGGARRPGPPPSRRRFGFPSGAG